MDTLGDRMKVYERAEAGRRLTAGLPALARVDGRGFSKFTRGMRRPYDPRMSRAMVGTARALLEQTAATVVYTQSDEISLLWHAPEGRGQVFFDGRVQKMVSTLAALATLEFGRLIGAELPEYLDRKPTFDARVWTVPSREEACNVFLWRELDATKNSVSMAARAHYSHKALLGKRRGEMLEMLEAKGVDWGDYPGFFRRGTYLARRTVARRFAPEELEALPPQHQARKDPDLVIERTHTVELELPPLNQVHNRVGVLFDAEPPRPAGDHRS